MPLRPSPSAERRRATRFIATMGLFYGLALAAGFLLSGCASTGDYRRPGTMIGPYDVTLTSHQEALGIR